MAHKNNDIQAKSDNDNDTVKQRLDDLDVDSDNIENEEFDENIENTDLDTDGHDIENEMNAEEGGALDSNIDQRNIEKYAQLYDQDAESYDQDVKLDDINDETETEEMNDEMDAYNDYSDQYVDENTQDSDLEEEDIEFVESITNQDWIADPTLPEGWKRRPLIEKYNQRKRDGSMVVTKYQYLSPDELVFDSRKAILDYMDIYTHIPNQDQIRHLSENYEQEGGFEDESASRQEGGFEDENGQEGGFEDESGQEGGFEDKNGQEGGFEDESGQEGDFEDESGQEGGFEDEIGLDKQSDVEDYDSEIGQDTQSDMEDYDSQITNMEQDDEVKSLEDDQVTGYNDEDISRDNNKEEEMDELEIDNNVAQEISSSKECHDKKIEDNQQEKSPVVKSSTNEVISIPVGPKVTISTENYENLSLKFVSSPNPSRAMMQDLSQETGMSVKDVKWTFIKLRHKFQQKKGEDVDWEAVQELLHYVKGQYQNNE